MHNRLSSSRIIFNFLLGSVFCPAGQSGGAVSAVDVPVIVMAVGRSIPSSGAGRAAREVQRPVGDLLVVVRHGPGGVRVEQDVLQLLLRDRRYGDAKA